jgi:hypothetical protein
MPPIQNKCSSQMSSQINRFFSMNLCGFEEGTNGPLMLSLQISNIYLIGVKAW